MRHGANKATIQIELYNPEGQDFCVTREITLDNKSTWKFQGKPVTHGQVTTNYFTLEGLLKAVLVNFKNLLD